MAHTDEEEVPVDAAGDTHYLIARDGRQSGPYSTDEIAGRIRDGRIVGTDLCWTEGMPGWALVSNVFEADGTLTPPDAPEPVEPEAAGMASAVPQGALPPPALHWAIVLLLSVATLGFFSILWSCAQAAWVRRIDPRSRGLYLILVGIGVAFAVGFISADLGPAAKETARIVTLAGQAISTALTIAAYFDMRRSMVRYFNSTEPIGLTMNGVLTFLFTMLYTQYHMSRIARWKRTGELPH